VFTIIVNAVDANFNVVSSITESVALTSTAGANFTVTTPQSLVAGTRNFTDAQFTLAGTYTVTATGSPSAKTGTSASVTTP
jgi:hypothetical protein